MTDTPTVLSVFGTRPDAIKMAPLVLELEKRKTINHVGCVTGQHRQMLDTVLGIFGITPKYDLDIMKERQTLEEIATRVLVELPPILDKVKPDVVLVHGDTSTAFVSALSSYYRGFKVGHVEAGLRTPDLYVPFPEEANRRLIDTICMVHLSPTETGRIALLAEGANPDGIFVTGNTVVDAFLYTAEKAKQHTLPEPISNLEAGRVITITAHRRESWGEDLRSIAKAIAVLAERFPDFVFVFPIHMNPVVRESMLPIMQDLHNLRVIEPLGYLDFVKLMTMSHMILTDSGGIQEEAPSLGIPVLVMRDVTERQEGIDAGCLELVGTKTDRIVASGSRLLEDEEYHRRMSVAGNPYGDGKASWRIANILERILTGEEIGEEDRRDDRFNFDPS